VRRSLVVRARERLGRERSPWPRIFAQGVPPRLSDGAGTTLLFATSVGGHPLARPMDSLVAVATWLRGGEPHMLL
jgi:hypothetical protein